MPLPSYNAFGYLDANPAGATTQNPLVSNPGGSTNPLAANPAGGGAPAVGAGGYNINPGTQSGSGIFGSVPGSISLPNPQQDLNTVDPDLAGQTGALSADTLAELQGSLSPATLNAISQAQDAFGITGGVNTSPLSLGTSDQNLENAGLSQYTSTLPGVTNTQTVSPELEEMIAQYNDLMSAAPNPLEAGLVNLTAQGIGTGVQAFEGAI